MERVSSSKVVNYITFDDTHCCACGACVSVCPNQAISMSSDMDGFLYPEIDSKYCVECGLCKEVCRYQTADEETSKKDVYAAFASDVDLMKSASGGLFATIAASVIDQGGVVSGCTMQKENGEFKPKHICVSTVEELDQLKGSKYVQSCTENAFREVKHYLDQGKIVLFSGTPCQVAGLYGYLSKDYDNLYTIDTICHGVPGEAFFNDYVKNKEKERSCRIIDFRFRDKGNGWRLFGSMITEDENGNIESIVFEPEESSYYQMFLNSYTYRKNCYSCPYASDKRPGDITIGDYWCIELVHPELTFNCGGPINTWDGVSCLIINRDKGDKLLDLFGLGISRWKSKYDSVARYNKQLVSPSSLPEEREVVFRLYKNGYDSVERWYQRRLSKIHRKRAIHRMIPTVVKQIIKRLR